MTNGCRYRLHGHLSTHPGRANGPPHRRALTDRLAYPAAALRTLGAVRVDAGRWPRRRRPRRDPVRHGRLVDNGSAPIDLPDRLVRGHRDRAKGRRMRAHRRRLRAGRRVRHHSQRFRLLATHLQRPCRHTRRDHDPRVLVEPHRARLRTVRHDHDVCGDQRLGSSSAPPLCSHDPPRHRRRGLRRASRSG